MKTTAKRPESSQAIQAKVNKQDPVNSILQKYKDKTAQLQSAEEEELLQGKFNSVQLYSKPIQKVDATEGWKLEQAYNAAIEADNEDVYYQTLNQLNYPNEGDLSDEPFDPMQFKMDSPIQLARSPYAISGPKSYGSLNNILYQCDAPGNIDFSNPKQYALSNPYPGLNPVISGSTVDVTSDVNTYGKGNRYQHFKDANQQAPHFGGQNGSSPAGLTWHHLTTKHQMHLVDRTVHSKHGHNGGIHLW